MKGQAVRIALCLSWLLPIAPLNAATRTGVSVVAAEGSQFHMATADGRVLRSPDLIGAVLGIDQGGAVVRLRIDAVEREGDVWLHTLSVEQPDGGFANLCQPAADGKARGFPIANADGEGFEIVCTDGARGKCVRLGFHPWKMTPAGGAVRSLYNACLNMIRADYGALDTPTTRDGTLIDVYDRWGVSATEAEPDFAFEAGWDEQGAVCVHHPRIAENVSLAQLEATIRRLEGRTGAVCTRAFARALGATIFNGSKP